MKTLLTFLALLSLAITAFATQPAPGSLHVRLLVFSGRENPVVVVSDPNQIASIMNLASSAKAYGQLKASEKELPSALGYRGIEVLNGTSMRADIKSFVVPSTKKSTSAKSAKTAPATANTVPDQAAQLEAMLLSISNAQSANP
jgi:hypothetical protein